MSVLKLNLGDAGGTFFFRLPLFSSSVSLSCDSSNFNEDVGVLTLRFFAEVGVDS